MRRELLTILFIRSSYKIRKINLLFVYYQIIKVFILLFIIVFIGLLTSVIFLKRSNNQLKQNIARLENRNHYLNSQETYKSPENNKDTIKNNIVLYDFNHIISDKVDVQDLKINLPENETTIDINFRLINLQETSDPIKGYVIIGGFPARGKISEHVFYPEAVQLNNKKQIVDYAKGEPFSIRNYKNENITLYKPAAFDINNIVISVFSEQGDIISRKVEDIHVR